MSFYRKRANYQTIEQQCEPILNYMRANCYVIKTDETPPDSGIREAFILNQEQMQDIDSKFKNLRYILRLGDFMEVAPLNNQWSELVCYVLEGKKTFTATASRTHVRLPKLSHLITLSPDDFFCLFKAIAASTNVSYGNTFSIPGDVPISPVVAQFFTTESGKSWRPSEEYADKKWTTKEDIAFIAALDPTRDNQFAAMQYLTVRQNSDILYFPLESAIALELEWDAVNDDYVIPDNQEV